MRYFYEAKVDRVIDGDTVDLVIDLGFDISYTARVRLHGVDTPELRTKDLAEKDRGLAAKAFTYDWLASKDRVFVKTLKDDTGKYGRILGYIYSDVIMSACLNDDIIDSGHGVPYYAGKR